MRTGTCYIVGAGEDYGLDFTPGEEDYVIGVDGGFAYLERRGMQADLVIGDFDSYNGAPLHSNVLALSREKDDTDMLAAVRWGINAGYKVFHIYCGTGGRIEHTIANFQVLAYLSENFSRGFLFDKDSVLTVISNERIDFVGDCTGFVSVFAYSERAEGVNLGGLKYPLKDAVLTQTFPLGVSNEFTGGSGFVSVDRGVLLVVFPKAAMAWLKWSQRH